MKTVNERLNRIWWVRRSKRAFFPLKKVQVRLIALEDEPLYIQFISESQKKRAQSLIKGLNLKKINRNLRLYIAVYKNKIVGDMTVSKLPSIKCSNIWLMIDLNVLPGLRGYGIAEKIAGMILRDIPDQNFILFGGILNRNVNSLNLFKKFSFRMIRDQEKEKFMEGLDVEHRYRTLYLEPKYLVTFLEIRKGKSAEKSL